MNKSIINACKLIKREYHSNRAARRLKPLPFLNKEKELPFIPPTELLSKDQLLFRIARAGPSHQLPVYSDYTNGRTRKSTIIRKIEGSKESFVQELKKIIGEQEILIRAGSIEVKGIYVKEIREWLKKLNF